MEDMSCTNKLSNNILIDSNQNKYKIGYFYAGPEKDENMKASAALAQTVYDEIKDMFTGITHSKETFLKINEGAKPCQISQRCVTYAFQKPFKDYLEKMLEVQIIVPLGIDTT